MDTQVHWEQIYCTKSPDETRWYEAHLQTSLDWISDAALSHSASIIDLGGGESTLVDDLLFRGYGTLTVLDVAGAAIRKISGTLGTSGSIRQLDSGGCDNNCSFCQHLRHLA